MQTVYVLRHNCCGEEHTAGVYTSMEAVLNMLQCQSNEHDHSGEGWRIECFDLEDAETTAQVLERVKLNRTLRNS